MCKRMDIQLVHHKKKFSSKPGFKAFKIVNEDLTSVELINPKLVPNRLIHVGPPFWNS